VKTVKVTVYPTMSYEILLRLFAGAGMRVGMSQKEFQCVLNDIGEEDAKELLNFGMPEYEDEETE